VAHFAELDDNNVVTRVVVIDNKDTMDENGNEIEAIGVTFCQKLFGGRWIQTSYNGKFRFRYASPGHTYDVSLDAFIPSKRFPSWVFNSVTYSWDPPVPMPTDGKTYYWDETSVSWIEGFPNI
jgi:hypothetical protein